MLICQGYGIWFMFICQRNGIWFMLICQGYGIWFMLICLRYGIWFMLICQGNGIWFMSICQGYGICFTLICQDKTSIKSQQNNIWNMIKLSAYFMDILTVEAHLDHICRPPCSHWYIEGILPKGPYLPCVSMAGRALFAGYHWYTGVPWQISIYKI